MKNVEWANAAASCTGSTVGEAADSAGANADTADGVVTAAVAAPETPETPLDKAAEGDDVTEVPLACFTARRVSSRSSPSGKPINDNEND